MFAEENELRAFLIMRYITTMPDIVLVLGIHFYPLYNKVHFPETKIKVKI